MEIIYQKQKHGSLFHVLLYICSVAKHIAMSVNVLCNFSVFICVIAAASLP